MPRSVDWPLLLSSLCCWFQSSTPSLYWISSGSNGKRQGTGSRRLRQSQQCDDKRARVFLRENGVDLRLTGKIALVTGSTAGIGFAIAKSLATEGAHVYVNGRTQERVDAAVATIRSHAAAAKVEGIAADFSGSAGAEAVIAKLPAVDVLVNNVGIFEPKPFAEIPDADWYRLFEINVMSGVRLSRHYLAGMLERNRRDGEQHPCRADGVGRRGRLCRGDGEAGKQIEGRGREAVL